MSFISVIATFVTLITSPVIAYDVMTNTPLSPTPMNPDQLISGVFDPFGQTLTCDILVSQNMVYSSGQIANLCTQAYNDCLMQGLTINQIAAIKQGNTAIPKGVTLKGLQENLAILNRHVKADLQGCQLAIASDITSTTQSLNQSAGLSD